MSYTAALLQDKQPCCHTTNNVREVLG